VQITKDQTVAEYERESGSIVSSVPEYKKEHTLLEWLGYGKDEPNPVIYECDIGETCDILLCTDGLSNSVSDKEIFEQLRKKQNKFSTRSSFPAARVLVLGQELCYTENIRSVIFKRRHEYGTA
jgi:serine/threonine protein phosphatase PrpC